MNINPSTQRHNGNTIVTYKYPLWYSLLFFVGAMIFLGVACLAIVGAFITIGEEIELIQAHHISYPPSHYLSLVGLVFMPIFIGLLGSIFAFTAYPEISISDQGFRVSSGFGLLKSRWLPWSAIRSAFYILVFGGENRLLLLGIDGLSWVYKVFGVFFFGTKSGILVGRGINNSERLFKRIRTERPELFRANWR